MARYLVRLHTKPTGVFRSWRKLERKERTRDAIYGPHVDGNAVSVVQARCDAALLKSRFTVVTDWQPIRGGYCNV